MHPDFTFSDVTITDEDIKNAIAEEPYGTLEKEENRRNALAWNPNSSNIPTHVPSVKPGYTTTCFVRSPWFVGSLALCLAVVIYHYWQDQKTKAGCGDAEEQEADQNNTTNIVEHT